MTTSPFKFLDSYTREDIGSFFGRERETGELFRLCFTAPMLVVYGGSGTGKTSLVQCGLQSKFNESDWLPVLVRRSGDLLASLSEAVTANTLTPIKSTDLGEQVANLYLDHFKPIYFLFDQFEELFIFGTHAECEAFFTAIKKLLEKERNAHVIFIVREEYLAELTRYERIMPGLIENRYRVERMARSRAVEVVEKLCAANNITCSEGFSSAMVDRLDPKDQGVELSYLQVYLDRCWRSRNGDEVFSVALLERIGYVDDLLGAFLDEQVAETPEPRRAESLLKAFVSEQGTKRQLTATEAHPWVNAIGTSMQQAEVDGLLQVLVAKRLLKDRDDRGRYELLHDALARQVFKRMTLVEKELIEVRQFVENASLAHRKRGLLLSADDLAYIAPYEPSLFLNEDLSAFVNASKERLLAAQKRKRRFVLGSLIGTLLAIFLGLAGFILKQRNDAKAFAEILERSSIIASADLMNVLFIGVNNPLTISFPGVDCQDLEPIISEGAELVEGDTCGRYLVRVHVPRQISISASALVNGKRLAIGNPVTFRVKRLPDPKAGIVQLIGSGDMTKDEVVRAKRLHLKIPNSDFSVDGSIVSFRMTAKGEVFHREGVDSLTAGMLARIKTLDAGDIIVFDSIFAEFGDKEPRTIDPIAVVVRQSSTFPVSLEEFSGSPMNITPDQLQACGQLRIGPYGPDGCKAPVIVGYVCEVSEIGSTEVVPYYGTSAELTEEIRTVFRNKQGLFDIEFKHIKVRCADGKEALGKDIWIRLIAS